VIDCLITEGLPGGGWRQDENALYIANLPYDTTTADMYTIFSCFGAVPPRGAKVMPGDGGQRRYGFINFLDSASAEFAVMAMDGVTQPDGTKLVVKLKNTGKDGEKGFGKDFAKNFGKGKWKSGNVDNGNKAADGPPPGVDADMYSRFEKKVESDGIMSAYDICKWYILEHLTHVTDEEEMKVLSDTMLKACTQLECKL